MLLCCIVLLLAFRYSHPSPPPPLPTVIYNIPGRLHRRHINSIENERKEGKEKKLKEEEKNLHPTHINTHRSLPRLGVGRTDRHAQLSTMSYSDDEDQPSLESLTQNLSQKRCSTTFLNGRETECCCGRADCSFTRRTQVMFAELEKDVQTAATLGHVCSLPSSFSSSSFSSPLPQLNPTG